MLVLITNKDHLWVAGKPILYWLMWILSKDLLSSYYYCDIHHKRSITNGLAAICFSTTLLQNEHTRYTLLNANSYTRQVQQTKEKGNNQHSIYQTIAPGIPMHKLILLKSSSCFPLFVRHVFSTSWYTRPDEKSTSYANLGYVVALCPVTKFGTV